MPKPLSKTLLLAAVLTFAAPPAAFADFTGFIGVNTSPANRQTTGLAVGAGFIIFGFEFEYASTKEDASAGAPSLKTGMGAVLVQTPALGGVQIYFEGGAGVFHEELGARSTTGFALGNGGGAKISLAGPLRLRVDYRLLNLGNGALTSPAHRIYAGLNLKF